MKKVYILNIILQVLINTSIAFAQSNSSGTISSDSAASIQNYKEMVEVSAFPNPASKTLTFVFKENDINFLSVEIYKLTGQPLLTIRPDNVQYTIDVTSMEEGIYFYKVIYNGKIVKTEKFMVLRK
jgi:hypothetical protein